MWQAASPDAPKWPTVGDVGEQKLLDLIRRRFTHNSRLVPVGIGDDGAILRVLGGQVVVSTDMLVEDVDFRRRWASPTDVGCKAAAVNLSDLAAMGARPRALFVSLAMHKDTSARAAMAILRGAHQTGLLYGAPVLGGDLSGTQGPLVINVTAIGDLQGQGLRRGLGQIGDAILVSGDLGAAAVALEGLEANRRLPAALRRRQLRPTPQVDLAQKLYRGGHIRSAIDLSDGLRKDGLALAQAHLGIAIEVARLPIHPMARKQARLANIDVVRCALSGGEDFELALAVAPEDVAVVIRQARGLGVTLTEVGHVIRERCTRLLDDETLTNSRAASGFVHFS